MSHGHDINYNHMTPYNGGVHALQANSDNDEYCSIIVDRGRSETGPTYIVSPHDTCSTS